MKEMKLPSASGGWGGKIVNLALIIVALAVIGFAINAVTGAKTVPFLPSSAGGEVNPSVAAALAAQAQVISSCGDDNKGNLQTYHLNGENSSDQFDVAVDRLYAIDDTGKETFYTSFLSGASGLGSAQSIQCGLKYALYVEGNSTFTSARTEFTMDQEQVTVTEENIPKSDFGEWAGLLVKVKDMEADAFIHNASSGQASNWDTANRYANMGADTNPVYYSTTSNGTAQVSLTDQSYNYRLYLKTNDTLSSVKRFTDIETFFGFDKGTNTQWSDPTSFECSSGAVAEIECEDVGSKFASTYEVCWKLSGTVLRDGVVTCDIAGKSKDGVRPTDEFNIGIVTSGRYKSNSGTAMNVGTNKDDSSETYVHTLQNLQKQWN